MVSPGGERATRCLGAASTDSMAVASPRQAAAPVARNRSRRSVSSTMTVGKASTPKDRQTAASRSASIEVQTNRPPAAASRPSARTRSRRSPLQRHQVARNTRSIGSPASAARREPVPNPSKHSRLPPGPNRSGGGGASASCWAIVSNQAAAGSERACSSRTSQPAAMRPLTRAAVSNGERRRGGKGFSRAVGCGHEGREQKGLVGAARRGEQGRAAGHASATGKLGGPGNPGSIAVGRRACCQPRRPAIVCPLCNFHEPRCHALPALSRLSSALRS